MVLADYKNTLGRLSLIEDGIAQLEAGTDPDGVEAEVKIEVEAGDTEDGDDVEVDDDVQVDDDSEVEYEDEDSDDEEVDQIA